MLRVGKEFCWEGVDREESSPMSSGVMRWRLSAALVSRSARSPTSWGFMTRRCGDWVRRDGISGGEREGLTSGERERFREQVRENARLRMGA